MRRKGRVLRSGAVVFLCGAGLAVAVISSTIAYSRDQSTALVAPSSSLASRATVSIAGESYGRTTAAIGSADYWATQLAVRLSTPVDLHVRHGPWKTGESPSGVASEAAATTGASAVLLMSSPADAERRTRLQVVTATTKALAAAKEASPDAQLILVGPLATQESLSGASFRGALRSAAKLADAVWVDPVAEEWFEAGQQRDVLNGSLDATEQRVLAQMLAERVARYVG